MRSRTEITPFILSIIASTLALLVGYKWYAHRGRKDEAKASEQQQQSLASSGSIYAPEFLEAVRPLYNLDMGCENMGPMLYSFLRFLKPNRVLEVGAAGYTSIYLLQALKDNRVELEAVANAKATRSGKDEKRLMENMFLNTFHEEESTTATLHIIEKESTKTTVAHLVKKFAKKLQCSDSLKLIGADCFDHKQLGEKVFDFIWMDDITTDDKFPALFEEYWNNHLKDGGYIAVHSTLTNTVTRKWMAEVANRKKREHEIIPVNFEVTPVDDEVGLNELAKSLQEIGDVEWQTKYRLEAISGFGIHKIILSALVKDLDAAQAIAKLMESRFADQIDGVHVVEDASRKSSSGEFQFMSFLEPHKRFQNSFSIFQKRTTNYREKIYSLSP
jgi:predicted O-methyltransferase YrrM